MTTIVTRAGKGSALTWVEADANFTNLNTYKLESLSQDLAPALGGNLDVLSHTISSSTGIVNIADEIKASKFNIDTTVQTGSLSIGQLAWNDAEGCLEYLMKGGNVNLQIGQEQVLMITNQTGSTLTDGQIVYINGSQGQRPTVALASATSEATSSKTIGMVTESILNGADGFITTVGIVHGLNTIAYPAGTALWLSTSSGLYTSTKPTSPNHGVFIGWVVRSHATSGSIYVHIQNGYELDELHDVNINSVSNNQLLKYNGTSLVWENWTPNFLTSSDIGTTVQAYDADLTSWAALAPSAKQDTLVSGTNIKTVNGNDLLGAGNIVISSGSGIGSIIAYKADGSQDNIDISTNTTMAQLTLSQELIANTAMHYSIDTTATYGWNDITAEINVKGGGSNNPSWAIVRNGLYAYTFSATVMQECWVNFHIPHSYTPGTNVFLHVHWVNPGTNTGNVVWGFEYSFAKGFGQQAYPATTTVTVTQASAGQYYHNVAEISAGILGSALEVDGILMVRVFRDAANVADTCTDAVALLTADVHHQTSRWATKNKAPNFYA